MSDTLLLRLYFAVGFMVFQSAKVLQSLPIVKKLNTATRFGVKIAILHTLVKANGVGLDARRYKTHVTRGNFFLQIAI